MGYAAGAACFESREEAQDYLYSGVPAKLLDSGSYMQFERDGSAWRLQTYDLSTGNSVLRGSVEMQPALIPCSNGQRFIDGLETGSMVGFILLAILSIKFIGRAAR